MTRDLPAGDLSDRHPPAGEPGTATPSGVDAELETRLAAAWESARRSELEDAYRELQALGSEFPGCVPPYLGRYWLLRLNSKLDSDRKPCDELFDCLFGVRPGPAAAALELYRREIERTPEESLSRRGTRVLRESPVEGAVLALAHPRWQEAARQARWDLIHDDLAALRATPIVHERETWRRLLRSAVEACLWAQEGQGSEIYDACAGELQQTADADSASAPQAPADSFVEVAGRIRRLRIRNVSPAFLRIVARSWSTSPADLYLQIATFVSAWVDNQGPLVRLLTDVQAEGGAVLERFAEILRLVGRELGREGEPFWTPEGAFPVVLEFLHGSAWRNYDAHFRTSLLRFCLHQRLSVEEFSETVGGDHRYATAGGHLSALAAADLPLRCAYESLRLVDA